MGPGSLSRPAPRCIPSLAIRVTSDIMVPSPPLDLLWIFAPVIRSLRAYGPLCFGRTPLSDHGPLSANVLSLDGQRSRPPISHADDPLRKRAHSPLTVRSCPTDPSHGTAPH